MFIDTKRMGMIKKKVRKLEDQLDYESRRWGVQNFQFAEYSWQHRLTLCASRWPWCRLWRDVTLNLKLKDIDAATEAKHRLEEKQRAEARERKEKEQQWETRVSSLTPSQGVWSSDPVTPWHLPSRETFTIQDWIFMWLLLLVCVCSFSTRTGSVGSMTSLC